ncbi:MAG: SDR family NAD(P)-dependent oxidoreductase [Myxococcota bacterium]
MTILILGNSDGIGLAATYLLLDEGHTVVSVSRSPLSDPTLAERVHHTSMDVTDPAYPDHLDHLLDTHGPFEACVWCVGIGTPLNLDEPNVLAAERRTFEVNLMAAVHTIERVLPTMLAQQQGHIIVLSSQADRLVSPQAPAYSASKAALSAYIEGLALAARPKGVRLTNIRLGFVDTKMAQAPFRPFMMTPDSAAKLILKSLRRRPVRITRPWRMAALLAVFKWIVAAQIIML